eukprot:2835601-Rhodomonas_salina.6
MMHLDREWIETRVMKRYLSDKWRSSAMEENTCLVRSRKRVKVSVLTSNPCLSSRSSCTTPPPRNTASGRQPIDVVHRCSKISNLVHTSTQIDEKDP